MTPYAPQLQNSAKGPVIILVDPQLGENIGMVARAMWNFNLTQLRLVNPRDGWPSEKARSSSANADCVIDSVRVFSNLKEAIADLHFIYATTARNRNNFKSVLAPKEAAIVLNERIFSGQNVGIIFGRERWGLTNEEIALSNAIISFPVNPLFPSLNISQAVLLMVWECMENSIVSSEKNVKEQNTPATKGELLSFLDYLEISLEERGYFRPVEKKKKMLDDLYSIFIRPELMREEVFLLRGIVSTLDKFSRQSSRRNNVLLQKTEKSE
ncbi:RNA methyltransferase [Candidatus Liberibacter asiaticus]|uniref:tRNA (cytidine/uridine-2'-O-)-methyltransferase TrmJ n=2 Tax=Liberibacter asiaticus TaxID=34021 RepID=C6XG74_LIBAP|nr:RNA methyltransferase [Candidatus Liberibacter asiaticus]ACT57377.1 tRNA/rRNA methyltransferase [Candidatus Liberibacter asiaticus str. psy62]AGH17140.1 tRNA/rRNA methyltransferase [Candidatus Liberibacter asiaticus str. gxpsy]ASK52941.1 RNA methyltransferase [Candidatus Liberibacter asiaticus]AWL14263.1 RNA methyltransferase [Candidatus Liberibacter asiaticus]KIH96029.1 RNA methyltransferase [Candidatus Liberibacter asiaticus]